MGNRDNTWQLDEEFTYNRAGHSLTFGAGSRYRRGWHLNGNGSALGSLSFQPVFTAQLASNSQGQLAPLAATGDSFADFLLGFPYKRHAGSARRSCNSGKRKLHRSFRTPGGSLAV